MTCTIFRPAKKQIWNTQQEVGVSVRVRHEDELGLCARGEGRVSLLGGYRGGKAETVISQIMAASRT